MANDKRGESQQKGEAENKTETEAGEQYEVQTTLPHVNEKQREMGY